MAKFVRARQGVPALLHPETGALTVPSPNQPIDASDALVKKFPWAFVSDEELAAEQADQARYVTEAPLEAATANPGEKRTTRRATKSSK